MNDVIENCREFRDTTIIATLSENRSLNSHWHMCSFFSSPLSTSQSVGVSRVLANMPLDTNADDATAVAEATRLFRSTFGSEPTVAGAAPGRVNLIGEHVDYNDGFVFPFALERNTYLVAAPQATVASPCEVVSDAYPNEKAVFVPGDSPLESDAPKWASYIKGMTALYSRYGLPVVPFRAAIVSVVPCGGGLSSSAALEMSTAVILEALNGLQIDPDARAKMGQVCEHEYAHVPCGIMDQLITSRAITGKALLIDCRSLHTTPIPLDHPDVALVVTDSRTTHELSGSEYPLRRNQCYAAAAAIANHFPYKSITHLRDCTPDMLDAVSDKLDEYTMKRARHAINEDLRTLAAADALKNGDLINVGRLMHESHISLRDLFEVSTKEIDALVDIAMSVEGVYGSRITGGGFGGCTVTLVHKNSVDKLIAQIHDRYPAVNGGMQAKIFATQAGCGARILTHLLSSGS